MATPPPPGSDDAIDAGCICARTDNNHGRGYFGMGGGKDPKTGETIYVYTVGCPVHSAEAV